MIRRKQERMARARRAAALTATAVLAAALVGCGSDPPDGGAGRIVRVPGDRPTIQDAVDAAHPGDLILIAAGTYREAVEVHTPRLVIRGEDRNRVVLDGRDELANGFLVDADQVAIENLTVQRYLVNGILFTGSGAAAGTTNDDGGGWGSSGDGSSPDAGSSSPQDGPVGWRASYVTAVDNGVYGLYALGTGPGTFDHDYASGHPDSGIYVGQCRSCGALVIDNVMERNAIGYENTNASGVTVARNIARRNRVGMTFNSQDVEQLAPQRGADVVANLVTDNDEPEAPATGGGFGFGIVVAGGSENRVHGNRVTGHDGVGILVVAQGDYEPADNQVTGNALSGNGVDVALAAEDGSTPAARGNCFGPDQGTTSPPGLGLLLPCGEAAHRLPRVHLAYPEPPEPFDYRKVPPPGDQPNRPGNPDGPWKIPGRTPMHVDVAGLRVPED